MRSNFILLILISTCFSCTTFQPSWRKPSYVVGCSQPHEKKKSFLELLSETKKRSIAPLGFVVTEYPIILISPDSMPECGTTLIGQVKKDLPISEAFEVSGWVAGTWAIRTPYNKLSPQNEVLLSSMNIDENQSYVLVNLDSNYPDYFDGTQGTIRSLVGLAVHEGFHLFYQGMRQNPACAPGLTSCPGWSYETPRGFLRNTCYRKNRVVEETHARELSALSSAMRSALIEKDIPRARQYVKTFILERENRYKLLRSEIFGQELWKNPSSCDQIEAEMEWQEGGAKFVDVFYLLNLGLLKNEDLFSEKLIHAYSDNPYYVTGMWQLILLQQLDSKFMQFSSLFKSPNTPYSMLQYGRIKQIAL